MAKKLTTSQLVPSDELYDLPFDQFSRQYLAKRLVEGLRQEPKLKILDVGGHNGKTREFFESDEVTVVDLYDVKLPGYVKGSGLDLPFGDDSFDVVTTFDVLEHVAAADRQKFVSEMARVSRNLVVIAAPFNDPLVARAEMEANEAWRQLREEPHPWLIEHIENGLPEREELEKILRANKLNFSLYHSNNLVMWSILQRLIFLADFVRRPEKVLAVSRYYNRHLFELGDASAPSYRLVYLASKRLSQNELEAEKLLPFEPAAAVQLSNEFFAAVQELVLGHETAAKLKGELDHARKQLRQKDREVHEFAEVLDDIYNSSSWRVAVGIRKVGRILRPWRRP